MPSSGRFSAWGLVATIAAVVMSVAVGRGVTIRLINGSAIGLGVPHGRLVVAGGIADRIDFTARQGDQRGGGEEQDEERWAVFHGDGEGEMTRTSTRLFIRYSPLLEKFSLPYFKLWK
jgi:hypothetical protein